MRTDEIRKGMYVRLLKDGRTACIDQAVKRGRNYTIEIEYIPRGYGYARVSAGELEILAPERVKPDKFRRFVRGEIQADELVSNGNIPENIVLTDVYHISPKDVLSGLLKLHDNENTTYGEFCDWFAILRNHRDEICFGSDEERSFERFDDEELLQYVYTSLMWIYYDHMGQRSRLMLKGILQEPIDTLAWYLEDKSRPLEEHRFTEDRMWHIVNTFTDRELERKPLDVRRLCRLCLDRLCDLNDLNALEKKGYLLFGGSKLYAADWELCRNIFERYYEATGESSAANTLGDIAVRGLCNDGQGDYETAFRYFSIGHASGYRESTYRLGDLFRDGLGVKKNHETAYLLYRNVYEDFMKRFVTGDYACRFAEAAVRMGDCYREGLFVQADVRIAYRYYLEAELAVDLRMKEIDYVGDDELKVRIEKALRDTRRAYDEHATRNIHMSPYFLGSLTHGYRRARLTWKKLRGGVLRISAETLPLPEEDDPPMILWAIEAADYCDLVDHIVFKTAPKAVLQVPEEAEEIIFNHIEYDWEGNYVDFYQDEVHTGRIETSGFSVDAPGRIQQGDL